MQTAPRGLRGVAREAGVSLATAQRALTRPELVAPETRARVQKVAGRLDYVPNANARALSLGQSGVVGLAISSLTNPIFGSTIAALGNAVRAAGKELLLAETGFDATRGDLALRALLGRAPDGIVMTFAPASPAVARLLRRCGKPVVELWDSSTRVGWHVAGMDNAEAGRQVARHFLATGRRRPALYGSLFHRDDQRWRGFAEAWNAGPHGSAARVLIDTNRHTIEETFDLGEVFFAQIAGWPALPDAVFATNDVSAAAIVWAALRRGIAVPGRLAVVGVGDQAFAATMMPRLSTVSVPGAAMGAAAAALVLAPPPREKPPERRIFPTEVIVRETG